MYILCRKLCDLVGGGGCFGAALFDILSMQLVPKIDLSTADRLLTQYKYLCAGCKSSSTHKGKKM